MAQPHAEKQPRPWPAHFSTALKLRVRARFSPSWDVEIAKDVEISVQTEFVQHRALHR